MQKPEHTISPPIGSVPMGGEVFISGGGFRMRFLSFDGAGGDAFDDIAREEDVHEQHRQDGERAQAVNVAAIAYRAGHMGGGAVHRCGLAAKP